MPADGVELNVSDTTNKRQANTDENKLWKDRNNIRYLFPAFLCLSMNFQLLFPFWLLLIILRPSCRNHSHYPLQYLHESVIQTGIFIITIIITFQPIFPSASLIVWNSSTSHHPHCANNFDEYSLFLLFSLYFSIYVLRPSTLFEIF